jgi:prepilin-type N-terminal cleavage/methylation domain-containing protein
MHPKKYLFGYSLLEMLIVIAIISIVSSIGFASYRTYQRRQTMESGVRMVRSDLRLAQEYAIAGKKPTGCTGDLNGYEFRRRNGTKYSIGAMCSNSATAFDIKEVTLPLGLTIQPFGGGNSFLFKVLGRGTDASGDINITLRYQDSGVSDVAITVTKLGEIK